MYLWPDFFNTSLWTLATSVMNVLKRGLPKSQSPAGSGILPSPQRHVFVEVSQPTSNMSWHFSPQSAKKAKEKRTEGRKENTTQRKKLESTSKTISQRAFVSLWVATNSLMFIPKLYLNPLWMPYSKNDRRRSIKFRQPLCCYFSIRCCWKGLFII